MRLYAVDTPSASGPKALREAKSIPYHGQRHPATRLDCQGDGYIYWYNQRWYDYTGTTPEEMEGWGWQSVHDPEVLPQVLEQWRASIATGGPFDMVFPFRGADGLSVSS